MVTISCSCGSVSTTRRNPLSGLTLRDRVEVIRAAHSVHSGFLALEVDAAWHPSSADPDVSCVVLADLDAVDASEGLTPQEARMVQDLLEVAHVRGRLLARAVDHGPLRVQVAPADDFAGTVTYVVQDGPTTLLEIDEPYDAQLFADLADPPATLGRTAIVQVDGLAGRIGLTAALAGVRRARTSSVA